MKLSVLVSGSGTNLQEIIDATQDGRLPNTEIIKVIADRECYALERAGIAHIPYQMIPRGKDFQSQLLQAIPSESDYIVLAGFLSILAPEFIQKWEGKIINIHPSLLPKYGGKGMYGIHVHRAVIENEEKESGATVHFVTEGIDEGEILLQEALEIPKNTTAQNLANKVHEVEYRILISALQQLEK